MKAVILKSNKNLIIQEKNIGSLDDDHCRVKIINAGICSSDIQRSYNHGAYFYPLIMGHELAGEIVEVGNSVEKYKKGDRIAIFPLLPCFKCEPCANENYAQCHNYSYYGSRRDGGFAEYLDVNKWNIVSLPDNIALKDAAAIEPLCVIIHALRVAELLDSENTNSNTIVIIGAGFLGLLMTMTLNKYLPNANITVIDRNKFKLDIAAKFAQRTVLLKSNKEWDKFIKKNAFKSVIEATGNPDAFIRSIEIVKHSGNLLWMGNITSELMLSKSIVSSILRKEITIKGTWNSVYKPKKPDDWKQAIQFIADGLQPSELITHFVTLDEIPDILEKLYQHKMGKDRFNCIKVMVNN